MERSLYATVAKTRLKEAVQDTQGLFCRQCPAHFEVARQIRRRGALVPAHNRCMGS